MSTLFVFALGALIVVAGLLTVTRRNPVHSALCMLCALCGLAAMFLGMRAPFLAFMQLLLYAGAIMVLFLFVIMLLTLREDELGPEPPAESRAVAAAASLGILGVLWYAIARRARVDTFMTPHLGEDFGSTEHFAQFLYTDYAVAFELVTVLVMAAIAGVVILARRPESHTLDATRVTPGGTGTETERVPVAELRRLVADEEASS